MWASPAHSRVPDTNVVVGTIIAARKVLATALRVPGIAIPIRVAMNAMRRREDTVLTFSMNYLN